MSHLHDLARALHARCVLALDEDPLTEVGKVRRVSSSADGWGFFVYVMVEDAQGAIRIDRTNFVGATEKGVEATGPDEALIAAILKEPIL